MPKSLCKMPMLRFPACCDSHIDNRQPFRYNSV